MKFKRKFTSGQVEQLTKALRLMGLGYKVNKAEKGRFVVTTTNETA